MSKTDGRNPGVRMRGGVAVVLAACMAVGCSSRQEEAKRVRFALCQTEARSGDVEGNARRSLEMAERAAEAGAQVVVFPEFSFVAMEDLLRGDEVANFDEAAWGLEAFGEFAGRRGCLVVVNHPRREGGRGGRRWNETLVVGPRGRVEAAYRKRMMAMVDEYLGMEPGERGVVVEAFGMRMGLMVCKDAAKAERFAEEYGEVDAVVAQFAHVVLEGEGGRGRDGRPLPFVRHPEPLGTIAAKCREAIPKALLLVNQAGKGPGWRMAGGSRVVDGEGRVVSMAGERACILLVDWERGEDGEGGRWVAAGG